MTTGKTTIQILMERYCFCPCCCTGMCTQDCPWCSIETYPCQCILCPEGRCNPACRHVNCSPRDAEQAEQRMSQRAESLRWNRIIHETRIQEFHLFQHERNKAFTLVTMQGQRIPKSGSELEAMALRRWLKHPGPTVEINPMRLEKYVRRHGKKLMKAAGEFNAGRRRMVCREQRVRLGLHPDWGRIGPMHGGHANWNRKHRRNGIRAENRARETGHSLLHISREETPTGWTGTSTQCGLTREQEVCILPGDHRAGRTGETAVCSECVTMIEWRDRETQAV